MRASENDGWRRCRQILTMGRGGGVGRGSPQTSTFSKPTIQSGHVSSMVLGHEDQRVPVLEENIPASEPEVHATKRFRAHKKNLFAKRETATGRSQTHV